MSEWKEVRLGDLCYKVCSGGTPKSTCSSYYEGGTIPWLNTKEINYNRIFETESHITEDGLNHSSAKWIDSNAVVVAMYGATAGRVAIAKVPMTTNQACCNLMIDSSKADYNFIYYYLSNSYKYLLSMANGAAQQNLNAQIIKDLFISLPSLDEQRSIASILSSLDSKIENNRKICANLEAQAQALFKHWFIDFAPFKDGKFVESELGMIPEGWRVGRLGDYCKVKSGYAFKSSWWTDKGNRIIKIKNISGNGNLDMKECSFVSPENCLKAKDFKAIPGDLIIAMTGATIGKFTIIPKFNDDVYINQRVGKFFLGEDPFEELPFIYSLLKTNFYSNQIVNMGIGSAQSNISGKDIESIKIPYNQREFSRFNHILRVVFETIVECQCEISRLTSLRDTLLPKLMSGAIKV